MYEEGGNFFLISLGFVRIIIGVMIMFALTYLIGIEKVWAKKEMKIQAFESALIDVSAKKHGIDLNVELAKLNAYDSKTFRDIVKEKVLTEVQKPKN